MAILAIVITVLLLLAVSQAYWYPLLLITLSQGRGVIEGQVTSVQRLRGRLVKIGVTQNLEVNAEDMGDEMIHVTGSTTRFVYMRPGQAVPSWGDQIQADVHRRLYWIRLSSLAWVESWGTVDTLKPGGRISVRRISS